MFNILDEKWLLGIDADGNAKPASIKDCMLHDFVDVKSLNFHEKHFYLYDYLAVRFLSTIAADVLLYAAQESPDAYDCTVEQIVAEEIKEGKISDSFRKSVELYFDKYHDRFDLFDETHPFIQFPTIDKTNDKSLQHNPLAPADSGRILPESFHFKKRISIEESFSLDDGKAVSQYAKDRFVITPQEAVYILLYLSSIALGVGSGNKSVLAGNAYVFETLNRASLHETILLNMPISGYLFDDDEDLIDFGIPVWRWEEIDDQREQILNSGKIKLMEGMFFPVKRVCLATENEKVMIHEESLTRKEKSDLGLLVDALRNLWANKYEPHALLHQIKSNEKNEQTNPYRKISPGSNLWLLLAATAQTKEASLQDYKKKKVEYYTQSVGASRHVQELSKSETLSEVIRVRYYYRMADSKWVHYKTGYVEGDVPREVLKDPIRQKYLCEMVQYIKDVKTSLRKYCKTYKFRCGIIKKEKRDFYEQVAVINHYYCRDANNIIDIMRIFLRKSSVLDCFGNRDD